MLKHAITQASTANHDLVVRTEAAIQEVSLGDALHGGEIELEEAERVANSLYNALAQLTTEGAWMLVHGARRLRHLRTYVTGHGENSFGTVPQD